MNRSVSALFTDLYQLTMMQAYEEEGLTEDAVFTLFVRRLPENRNFLVACGLDPVLDYLEALRFTDADLGYLATLDLFSERFLQWLEAFRFQGEVRALREGTPVFANEPILEIRAPLPAAQLVETLVMNQYHLQTVLASKAARVVGAAAGRSVVDFGTRRTHGVDAALKAVRAFYIGGVVATSNVLAGRIYGVPVAGTMAHSYIQAHDDERQAFAAFVRRYPDTTLLVDTYDTLEGVNKLIDLASELGAAFRVRGVRLDSGDLLALSKATRQRLDEAQLGALEIFASGSLDEYAIAELVAQGAPIDGFGVGTRMGVSADAPDLDFVYKLCEYAGRGRAKLATGKPVLPGRKQVFRQEANGRASGDIVGRMDEDLGGRALLHPMMEDGRRLPASRVSLDEARDYARREIAKLPEAVRAMKTGAVYEVTISDSLAAHRDAVHAELMKVNSDDGDS